ncbi:hypothetical protein SENBN9181_35050 [Salmonella enterica subsp. enterica serovar Typhimurium]|nr:hypothetical protein SENBN9181_35050 [Salmonella enterica subsp. enterica serovar Typhimurium]
MFCLIIIRQCNKKKIVSMASQTQNKQANRLVERPMVNWAIAVVSENKIDVLMKEERLSKGL